MIESASDTDYVPQHGRLAEDGYDLVIGVGFAQGRRRDRRTSTRTRASRSSTSTSPCSRAPENVVGLLFQEEQAGYLAGVLAAEVAKAKGFDTISSVGGVSEPPVDRFIAGYQAGAEATMPGITP